MVVVLVVSGDRVAAYVAAAVFAVGAATDRLDGYLARRTAHVTRIGQVMDPIADKVFVIAPVVTLLALGRFPLWAALVIVARELAVSALRAWLAGRGRDLPVSRLAKWKTGSQLAAILLYLLPVQGRVEDVRLAVLVGAVALTAWSAADYGRRALRPGAAA